MTAFEYDTVSAWIGGEGSSWQSPPYCYNLPEMWGLTCEWRGVSDGDSELRAAAKQEERRMHFM